MKNLTIFRLCIFILLYLTAACQSSTPSQETTTETEQKKTDSVVTDVKVEASKEGKAVQPSGFVRDAVIAYEVAVFEKSYQNCDRRKKSCTYVEVMFPTFSPNAGSISQALMRETLDWLNRPVSGDKPLASYDKVADELFKIFEQNRTDRNSDASYFLTRKVNLIGPDQPVVVLKMIEESFTGGAHGNRFVNYVNIHRDTGKKLNIQDLSGDEKAFTQAAKTAFYGKFKLKPTDDLEEKGFWFKNNQFHLSEQYRWTNEGIEVLYNPYDVASYATGEISLFVPWQKRKPS